MLNHEAEDVQTLLAWLLGEPRRNIEPPSDWQARDAAARLADAAWARTFGFWKGESARAMWPAMKAPVSAERNLVVLGDGEPRPKPRRAAGGASC